MAGKYPEARLLRMKKIELLAFAASEPSVIVNKGMTKDQIIDKFLNVEVWDAPLEPIVPTEAQNTELNRAKVVGKKFARKNEHAEPPTYEMAMLRALDVLYDRLLFSDPAALLLSGVVELLVADNRGATPDPLA